jgi:hypothetical protein
MGIFINLVKEIRKVNRLQKQKAEAEYQKKLKTEIERKTHVKKEQEKNDRLKEAKEFEEKQKQIRQKYHHLTFNVAGVTFKNGRKTRQAILRKIKFEDEPFCKIESVEFEPYEFDGEQAYYIKVNGETIGNVPRKNIEEFEKYQCRNMTITLLEVSGGQDFPYGCTITLKFDEFSE